MKNLILLALVLASIASSVASATVHTKGPARGAVEIQLGNNTDRPEKIRVVVYHRATPTSPRQSLYDKTIPVAPRDEDDPQQVASVPLGEYAEVFAHTVAYPSSHASVIHRQPAKLLCSIILAETWTGPPEVLIYCE